MNRQQADSKMKFLWSDAKAFLFYSGAKTLSVVFVTPNGAEPIPLMPVLEDIDRRVSQGEISGKCGEDDKMAMAIRETARKHHAFGVLLFRVDEISPKDAAASNPRRSSPEREGVLRMFFEFKLDTGDKYCGWHRVSFKPKEPPPDDNERGLVVFGEESSTEGPSSDPLLADLLES